MQAKVKTYYQKLDLQDDSGLINEYIKWHSPGHIWNEVIKGIHKVGINEMEIFNHKNKCLMIVVAPNDFDWIQSMNELASLPRQEEWEEFVGKYQKVEEGQSSNEKWEMMKRVFALNDRNYSAPEEGYTKVIDTKPVNKHYLTIDLKNDCNINELDVLLKQGGDNQEIIRSMKDIGIIDMEIFRAGNRLNMMLIIDNESDWQFLASQLTTIDAYKVWEKSLQPFFNNENYSILSWQPMQRIFRLSDNL